MCPLDPNRGNHKHTRPSCQVLRHLLSFVPLRWLYPPSRVSTQASDRITRHSRASYHKTQRTVPSWALEMLSQGIQISYYLIPMYAAQGMQHAVEQCPITSRHGNVTLSLCLLYEDCRWDYVSDRIPPQQSASDCWEGKSVTTTIVQIQTCLGLISCSIKSLL